jgi:hypothetical protein
MSKKRISTYRLVIDASIAQAAGTLEARHPTAERCRDFLIAVRGVCHRMTWSPAIKAEWEEHQSTFATQWLVTMMKLRKLWHVKDEPLEELRQAIEGHSEDENITAIMLKDAHLLEAAVATDSRVASLDDVARGHFRRLAATLDSLRLVMWVNPAVEEEQAVEWVEKGVPGKRPLRLKP